VSALPVGGKHRLVTVAPRGLHVAERPAPRCREVGGRKTTKLPARRVAEPATPARSAEAPGFTDKAALLRDLRTLVQAARQHIATVANATYTQLCWQVGRRRLLESLQAGRAACGKQILATVSQELTTEFGTGVLAAYDKLAAQLDAAPISTPSGTRFDTRDLSRAFERLLPSEPSWPLAVRALADALAGDFTALMALAAQASAPSRSDTIIARLCNDYGTRRGAADYLSITEASDTIHPRFFTRLAIGERAAQCAQWPAADPPVIRDVRRRLATPALLIGSEFDLDAPLP
jgi:hypothetical protein